MKTSTTGTGFFDVTLVDVACMVTLVLVIVLIFIVAIVQEREDNESLCLANGYTDLVYAHGWYCVKRTECESTVVPVSELEATQ